MPVNYYRADVRLPLEVSTKLNLLRQEIFEKTGKKVSRSKVIEQIVSNFFKKSEAASSPLAFMEKKSR
jgi:hypothetical protein